MSRYGRLDLGPDKRVTPEDLRCWADLVVEAGKAAEGDASAAVPALAKVADAARHACAPGVVTRENPCVVLSQLARRYCAETVRGRRELQMQLLHAAETARNQLNGFVACAGDREARPPRPDAGEQARERRSRRDIDG